jgi:hypothetical protein
LRTILLFALLFIFNAKAFAQLKDSVKLSATQAGDTIHLLDSTNQTIQSRLDSLQLPRDSATRAAMVKAEAIKTTFQKRADSLHRAYQKPINQIHASKLSLQHKIDSLQKLKLPTAGYTTKLDSVNELATQKTAYLSQKIESLKSKAANDLKKIQLPPNLQGQADKLQQSISGYTIPIVDGKISEVALGRPLLPGIKLPNGINNLPTNSVSVPGTSGIEGLNQLNLPSRSGNTNVPTDLNKTIGAPTEQIGDYKKEIEKVSKGELPDTKQLEQRAEEELKNRSEVKEVTGQTSELEKYKKQFGSRPDSAMLSTAKEEMKTEAINHFAGKEEILKGAMDKMAKLKSRYSEVKSMADLPKRLPNPLKGNPLIERLVPAFTLHFMKDKNVLMDINPSIAYKIYPKWKAGLGWTERITFDNWKPTITERVFGIRTYNEVSLPKGFQMRGDIEFLNAIIPPLLSSQNDKGIREWETNIIVGLKKDFKIYKSFSGNVQTMYRIWSDHDKVPYPDRFIIRMGFELALKKKSN